MTKKLFTGIVLVILVDVVIGLQIILTHANHAYGQWILPTGLNEIHQNAHHGTPGIIVEGYNQTTTTTKIVTKP